LVAVVITAEDVGQPPAYASPPRKRHTIARISHVIGELLLTAGMIILLFVGYQLFWTGVETGQAQDSLKDQLFAQWADDPRLPQGTPTTDPTAAAAAAPLTLGDGVAIIRVPRWGSDYAWVVVEGVRIEDLRRGPGHYPDTALPGAVGNFAVAGHRTTYGAPFYNVEELRTGDEIVVETATSWLTYAVAEITYPVPVDSSWAVSPNPHDLATPPTQAMMTMTTCHPRFSSSFRFLVFSELVETLPKGDGVVPAALAQVA